MNCPYQSTINFSFANISQTQLLPSGCSGSVGWTGSGLGLGLTGGSPFL